MFSAIIHDLRIGYAGSQFETMATVPAIEILGSLGRHSIQHLALIGVTDIVLQYVFNTYPPKKKTRT